MFGFFRLRIGVFSSLNLLFLHRLRLNRLICGYARRGILKLLFKLFDLGVEPIDNLLDLISLVEVILSTSILN